MMTEIEFLTGLEAGKFQPVLAYAVALSNTGWTI